MNFHFFNFSKLSKITFICILFSLVIHTTCKLDVIDLTDSNIDSIVGDGTGKNWLLMFYLDSCPHCKNANEAFKQISRRSDFEGEDAPVKNLQIGRVECNANNWSCLRFNISRVPYIVMLQNDKLFELETYVTQDKLYNFIVEDKLVEKGQKIPPMLGWSGIVMRIFEESVSMMNQQIQEFIDEKLGPNKIKWDTNYTIILLATTLIAVLVLEYMIVSLCFGKKQNKKIEPIKTNVASQLIEESKQDESNLAKENNEEIQKSEKPKDSEPSEPAESTESPVSAKDKKDQ
jgi:hypothetical protein